MQVDSRANDLLSRLNDTKSKWEDCEKKVVELDHRLRSAQNEVWGHECVTGDTFPGS